MILLAVGAIFNGIFNDKESQGRLKQARQVCGSQLQELAKKKKRKVEAQRSNDIAKAGGLASLVGGGIQQFLAPHGSAESADVDAVLGTFIFQNGLPF